MNHKFGIIIINIKPQRLQQQEILALSWKLILTLLIFTEQCNELSERLKSWIFSIELTWITWHFISELKQMYRGRFTCIYWLYMYFLIKTAFIIDYTIKMQMKITIVNKFNPFLCKGPYSCQILWWHCGLVLVCFCSVVPHFYVI